jgi:hypothetical protein
MTLPASLLRLSITRSLSALQNGQSTSSPRHAASLGRTAMVQIQAQGVKSTAAPLPRHAL